MLFGTSGGNALKSHFTGSPGATPGAPVATSALSSSIERRTFLSFGFHFRWFGQSTVVGALMPGRPIGGLGGGFFLGSSATVSPGPPPEAGAGTGEAGLTGLPFDSPLARVPPVGVVAGIFIVSNGFPVGTSTSRSIGVNAPANPAVRSTPRTAHVALIGHLRRLARTFPLRGSADG